MPNLVNAKEEKSKPKDKVDLSVYNDAKPHKKKKLILWRLVVVLLVVIVLFGLGILTKVVLAINSTNDSTGKTIGFFEQIKNIVINPDDLIQGEEEDRINILLAGIGGSGHQGAYLADTIIVASVKPSTNEVAMLSIPRDLYVEIPEYGWRKINNSLAFGRESDYPGGGEALLAAVVEKVINQPIHYYARIDFEGFRKAIDDLGGIKVIVDQSFADYEYPDYNYGYQTISFTAGEEHMNGERALQFVRSRHGTNGEGSDFARSERQQKILFALRDKFFSLNTLINPASIVSALGDLGNHNKTNLQIWEIMKLAKMIEGLNGDGLVNEVLDTSPGGYLVSDTTADGAYILRPRSGDFSEIQYLADNLFNMSFIVKEQAKIEIQNSTNTAGLATEVAERLKDLRYNVVEVGNAGTDIAIRETTIYDLSRGEKPFTVVSLKNMLNATISPTLPAFMTDNKLDYDSIASSGSNTNISSSSTDIDILVVIGKDYRSTDDKLTWRAPSIIKLQ